MEPQRTTANHSERHRTVRNRVSNGTFHVRIELIYLNSYVLLKYLIFLLKITHFNDVKSSIMLCLFEPSGIKIETK